MTTFQTQINANPAPAVEGDFASANPMASMLALAGAFVAGAAGVTVGRFAFAKNSNGVVSNQHPGVASRLGFVQRDQQGVLITGFLAGATMVQQPGYETTLFSRGEFWGRFSAGSAGSAGGAAIGQKVYASYYDGSLSAAAAATPPTETFTASLAGTTMTVTVAGAAPLSPGMPVSGTGIGAGVTIAAYGTGTGGLGTYTLSAAVTTEAAETITATLAVETPWTVDSACNAGELAQISTNG